MKYFSLFFLGLQFWTFASASFPVHAANAEANQGNAHYVDLLVVGFGLMGATLSTLVKELDAQMSVEVYERLEEVGAESSDAMNNAGTGHSALCELNYTPEHDDGSVDIKKAVDIMEDFEVSKQFWAYLVQNALIGGPGDFIHAVPHFSWVKGAADVDYLRRRYEALHKIFLFDHMEFSDEFAQIAAWLPLMAQGRSGSEKMAATRSTLGTDIDFGALTRNLFQHLSRNRQVPVFLSHEVRGLSQNDDGLWRVSIRNLKTRKTKVVYAKKVFIGAGGGALPLLQRSGIRQAENFGGFPISGQFLVSNDSDLAARHFGKVYGKAAVGAPPMSVPHFDTRIIDGQRKLLFGPFAGVTTKFLKYSSPLDLIQSVRADNLGLMLSAGFKNIPLIGYLMQEATKTDAERMEALREFLPQARAQDWTLVTAGQRVQIIENNPDDENGSTIQFGTKVVSSDDGTLTALLGASPGASTSVSTMIRVLAQSFQQEMGTAQWRTKLREMIPSQGVRLSEDNDLATAVRKWTTKVLDLENCSANL